MTSNVLRSIEPHKLNDKVLDAFKSNEVSEMIRQGYIIILLIKFYPDSIISSLNRRIIPKVGGEIITEWALCEAVCATPITQGADHQHSHLFMLLHDPPAFLPPTPLIEGPLWFKVVTVSHSRFIYDVYHIMIHSFNGIFESDYYIKLHINKYFKKFLSYRHEKQDLTKKILKR